MSWRSQVRSKVHRDKSHLSQEAGAAMFQGLRIRLTLWYCLASRFTSGPSISS